MPKQKAQPVQEMQTLNLFARPEASEKPSLICVGTVTAVEEAKLTKPNPDTGINYIMARVTLTPLGAGRTIKENLLFRPEWLDPSFNPASFKSMGDAGRGPAFVYASTIIGADGNNRLSKLEGLAGSPEAFSRLASLLLGLPKDEKGVPSLEDLTGTLTNFFLEDNQGVQIGYVLRQATQKAVGVDEETGEPKTVKVLTDNYEVGQYFYPTSKSIANWVKTAENKPEKYRMTFDPDTIG